jgi:phosphoribosylanthranilate isomerase
MSGVLLKICGLTNDSDLRLAQECGADFLGVIVEVAESPRSVGLEEAKALAAACPERIVAVTTSDDAEQLRRIVEALRPRALQLHNPKALEAALPLREITRLWLAVPVPVAAEDREAAVRGALELIAQAAEAGVEMIVLDTCAPGDRRTYATGGTGRTSDWGAAAEIVRRSPLPVLLAGGISPDNAAEALARVCPAGLDASSRLESSPGRKDHAAVRKLAARVKPPT